MSRSILFLIIGTLTFSTQGLFIKLCGDSIAPPTLNFYRIFFAFCGLAIITPLLDKNTFKVDKGSLREYAFLGAVLAIGSLLYTWAFTQAPISNVILIAYSYPLFVLLFAPTFTKEKIDKRKFLILLVALLGIGILNPFKSGPYFWGNLVAIFSAVFYAITIIGYRKEETSHGVGSIFWTFLFASLFLSPLPFFSGTEGVASNLPILVVVGIFSTGLSHLLINLGLRAETASLASLIDLILSPIFAILLAVFFIQESVNSQIILGGSLLLMAGILLEIHQHRIQKMSLVVASNSNPRKSSFSN
jgi:drug/metabolite transporter (DMT)-like permease